MESPFASLAPDGRTVLWFQNHRRRTPDEWEASRARKIKKLEKSMPLFAGMVESIVHVKSTDEYAKADEAHFRKLAEGEVRDFMRGSLLRAIVAKLIPPERLVELDEWRFRTYPADVTYTWGFWFLRLKEVSPTLAHELCLNHQRHEFFSRWHSACPTCGKPLSTFDGGILCQTIS